jgi:hypothetical protein
MIFGYFDNSAGDLGLWILLSVAMVVIWGLLSWAVVSTLRHWDSYGKTHGDGRSR